MSVLPMTDLVELMMAAGPVRVIPVRVAWPMHKALAQIDTADRDTLRTFMGAGLMVRSDPAVGHRIEGLDEAFDALVQANVLTLQGTGYLARWRLPEWSEVGLRRRLLAIEPKLSALAYRAGKRWATFAATALKNADTAAESWASHVLGGTPRLRQETTPGLR